MHRGSVMVLCHFVHRAFVLEAHLNTKKAPFKYDEGTIFKNTISHLSSKGEARITPSYKRAGKFNS